MSDVTLMEELVGLKNLLDSNDEIWEREMVATERNVLQALFSRTERLMRTLRAAACENAEIVAAAGGVKARIDAAVADVPIVRSSSAA